MRKIMNDDQLEGASNGLLVDGRSQTFSRTFSVSNALGTSVLMLGLCTIGRLRQLTSHRQINKATPRLHNSKNYCSAGDWQDWESGNGGFRSRSSLVGDAIG
jgi:hypothetical protein